MSCSGLPMMQTAFSTLQYLGPVDQHARYCNVGYSAASPRGKNLTAENVCTKSAGVKCPVGPLADRATALNTTFGMLSTQSPRSMYG